MCQRYEEQFRRLSLKSCFDEAGHAEAAIQLAYQCVLGYETRRIAVGIKLYIYQNQFHLIGISKYMN